MNPEEWNGSQLGDGDYPALLIHYNTMCLDVLGSISMRGFLMSTTKKKRLDIRVLMVALVRSSGSLNTSEAEVFSLLLNDAYLNRRSWYFGIESMGNPLPYVSGNYW